MISLKRNTSALKKNRLLVEENTLLIERQTEELKAFGLKLERSSDVRNN